ncbi:MAG: twin-arginine translocase TatA/TatE family subunit [Chloroflexota bacterium]|nr:twin-arginine translocase TatA/TatE family subunit [Chloroflexota bacterium]
MPNLGPTELIIILVIVLAIFGAGKLASLGGALGKSVREFRQAVNPEDEAQETAATKVEGAPTNESEEEEE